MEEKSKKQKAIAAGTKAVDLADKGFSLIDNIATIFNGIKWLIIAGILFGAYLMFSWVSNLMPSSEDVAKAADATKAAVVQTADKTKAATIEGAAKLKAASIENAAKAKVAYENSETVAAAKDQLGKLADEAVVVKTDIQIAIDESQTINDAKDKAKSTFADLASNVPPLHVTAAFNTLIGKDKPTEEATDEAGTKTKVDPDEKQ